ncbi:MAG TPA: ATP synthase F0 subunit A [Nitrospirae bacterium]|nr:ATP synthase subunit a [bacterium BMS3Bbin09]HDZ84745.1 ATP synthase F0 subunit A [Nitrospirota bacterium]
MHSPIIFPVNILVNMGIPEFVAFSWVAVLIIIVLAVLAKSSLKMVPSGVQNLVEVIIEFFLDIAESTIGHQGRHFLPFIATIGIYILVCNLLGLLPGGDAPTSNLNTNVALALPVFFATHIYGIKAHKFAYIKHFVGPIRSLPAIPLMILMFIIELIGHLARPLTLSVRLFGNMVAKHKIILIFLLLAPWVVPTAILCLGVLVSVIQAYVFVLLTSLYLAGAVEEAH